MEDNKIIGFNLSLNFGFTNNEDYYTVITRIEDMIDKILNDKPETGAILLGGKADFIRNNGGFGIEKLKKESDD